AHKFPRPPSICRTPSSNSSTQSLLRWAWGPCVFEISIVAVISRYSPLSSREGQHVPHMRTKRNLKILRGLARRPLPQTTADGNARNRNAERHKVYMAREAIKRDLVIHCEVKVLTLKSKLKFPIFPKHTPISVFQSSPIEVIMPFSNHSIHGTRFTTKGSHSKSYWPWQFPQTFPKSDTVFSAPIS